MYNIEAKEVCGLEHTNDTHSGIRNGESRKRHFLLKILKNVPHTKTQNRTYNILLNQTSSQHSSNYDKINNHSKNGRWIFVAQQLISMLCEAKLTGLIENTWTSEYYLSRHVTFGKSSNECVIIVSNNDKSLRCLLCVHPFIIYIMLHFEKLLLLIFMSIKYHKFNSIFFFILSLISIRYKGPVYGLSGCATDC